MIGLAVTITHNDADEVTSTIVDKPGGYQVEYTGLESLRSITHDYNAHFAVIKYVARFFAGRLA